MPKELPEEVAKKLQDRVWRMHMLYKIRTKMRGQEGIAVQFTPNIVQKKIYKSISTHNRTIILKPRQLGCTTGIILYLLDSAMYEPNQFCRTIAHKKDSAIEIFSNIAQFAYKELQRMAPEICPKAEYTTKAELQFLDNGSKFSVATDARGMTPTKLHLTEAAYQEDEPKMVDSIESLPMGATGIAESTAQGKGNWFHQTFMSNWQLLQQGKKPEWNPLFFAWFDDPNNALPTTPDMDFFFPTDCDKQGKQYRNADGTPLSRNQLMWWDRKRYALRDRLPELYPSCPEEAFIHSTGRVYPEFQYGIHVLPRMSFPDYEIAMDYGQTNPQVFQKWHQDHDGNFICFGEFYKRNSPLHEQRKWLEAECPEKISPDGWIHVRFPDPTVFGENQIHDVQISPGHGETHRASIADEYAKHKILLYQGVQNAILPGIRRVGEYLQFDPMHPHPFLRDENGEPRLGSPRLFYTEDCKGTIDEYSNYHWPKDAQGSLNQSAYETPMKSHDHGMDCTKNVLLTWGKSLIETRAESYVRGTVGGMVQSYLEAQMLRR